MKLFVNRYCIFPSAGIGRTGCFIAASIGIQQLLEENSVDVLGIVCSLRLDRLVNLNIVDSFKIVSFSFTILLMMCFKKESKL